MTPHAGWLRHLLAVLVLAAGVLSLAWWAGGPAPAPVPPTHLALLLPDGWPQDDVQVQAWRLAADETGFPLQLLSASELLRTPARHRDAALIVPDAVHRRMNDALLSHLEQRVRDGALLMLVHDAGVADMDGHYHPEQSRLSVLAGVRYALYGTLGAAMLREQEAWIDAAALPSLQLPPGKVLRQGGDTPLTSHQPAPGPAEELAVAGYQYGRLRYTSFTTAGRFDGQRLMHADNGSLLAGLHGLGRGQVLFVNLPLTYLKLRTDGLFLHSFLRYFAQDVARLPQLSPMADARGALVLNWHVDAAQALTSLQSLETMGAFAQGPYSIHLTAGPDNNRLGDGQGVDLAHNMAMRQFVQRQVASGDEVGSHGGWMHNAFGRTVHLLERTQSAELITRNSDFVRAATGRPVREYSSPLGNHPAWLTPWLRAQGVQAYYFTGDIGMPPTRSYQDGQPSPADIWAFPVLNFGGVASFEEAHEHAVAESDMAAWLTDVSSYCADQRTLRLVYFHPSGVLLYPQAFAGWLQHTRSLVDSQRLRWTTMAQHVAFANRRLGVRWQLQDSDAAPPATPAVRQLVAEHPASLDRMAWLLPADGTAAPRLVQGQAEITRDGSFWRVRATGGTRLVVALQPAVPGAAPARAPAAAPASATAPAAAPAPWPASAPANQQAAAATTTAAAPAPAPRSP